MYVCMYMYVYVCVCMRVCVYVCMYVCMYVCSMLGPVPCIAVGNRIRYSRGRELRGGRNYHVHIKRCKGNEAEVFRVIRGTIAVKLLQTQKNIAPTGEKLSLADETKSADPCLVRGHKAVGAHQMRLPLPYPSPLACRNPALPTLTRPYPGLPGLTRAYPGLPVAPPPPRPHKHMPMHNCTCAHVQ